MSSEVGKAHVSIFPVMTGFRSKVDKEVRGAAKGASKTFKSGFNGAGKQAGRSLGSTFKQAFAVASKGVSESALAPFRRDVAKAAADMSRSRAKMADDAGKVRVAEMRLADAVSKSGRESTQAVAAEERLASARRKLEASSASYKASLDRLKVAEGALAKAQSASPARLGFMGRAFSRLGTVAGSTWRSIQTTATGVFRSLPAPVQSAMTAIGGHVGSLVGKMGGGLSGAAQMVSRGVGGMVSAVATGVGAVAGAVASAAAALGGLGVKAYAEYEQLVGGVDTFFKSSSAKVQQYAAEAYKTSGLSANAYMEQVTGFSATLIRSLGGDTAKAADYADMAIRDMSDNANKFGSNIQGIQDAYQGFAKQNFTMLDNLRLGYGGTKSEMERLIQDANRVKQANGEMADLSIDSYSDIVEAIHLVQTEMGITGTTAQEASTTITGSISAAKASWKNWLTEMGKDNGDIKGKTDELVESIAVAAGNLVPRIATVAGNLFTTLGTNAAAWLQNDLPVLLGQFSGWVDANLPTLLQKGMEMLGGIADGIIQNLPQIMVVAAKVIAVAASTIIQNLPQMIRGGIQMMGNLATGFLNAVPQLVGKIPGIVQRVWNGFTSIDWGGVGRNIVDGIKRGLANAAQSLVGAAMDLGKKALNGVKGVLGIKSPSRVFRDQVGKMIPAGVAVGIDAATPSMLATAARSARRLVGGFSAQAAPPRSGRPGAGVQQTFVFNHPVETPYEFARAVRARERSGLAAQI